MGRWFREGKMCNTIKYLLIGCYIYCHVTAVWSCSVNLLNNTNMINSVIDTFLFFCLLVQERRKGNSCLCPDSLCPLLQVSILLLLLYVYNECLCDCLHVFLCWPETVCMLSHEPLCDLLRLFSVIHRYLLPIFMRFSQQWRFIGVCELSVKLKLSHFRPGQALGASRVSKNF